LYYQRQNPFLRNPRSGSKYTDCSTGALQAAAQSCGAQGVAVQVLGSGGPELQDKRAMSSYLVWENGQTRVLIDAGGGSALRFGESGAQMSQLDVILFTHFHVDHSGDFAALIKSSWFEDGKLEAPRSLLPEVHRLYFEPQYSEFAARTMWSLSNAFTSAFKKLDPVPQFKATAKLGGFLAQLPA
jgi:glyoxylase-like metal-dependent hydrolase (beta-lactamase superfamily II)